MFNDVDKWDKGEFVYLLGIVLFYIFSDSIDIYCILNFSTLLLHTDDGKRSFFFYIQLPPVLVIPVHNTGCFQLVPSMFFVFVTEYFFIYVKEYSKLRAKYFTILVLQINGMYVIC